MVCECPQPARENVAFCNAVTAALTTLCARPEAMSIVRNGGCEQSFRNQLLLQLESDLECVSFTEGAGRRVDICLYCRQCGNLWGNIEIKNNFMHRKQKRWVHFGWTKARQQLEDGPDATKSFYLHILTQLVAGEESILRGFQNTALVTPYKHFLCFDEAAMFEQEFEAFRTDNVFMGGPALTGPIEMVDEVDNNAQARVWCWGYQLNHDGNFENLMGD